MVSSPLSKDYAPLWYGYLDESGDPYPASHYKWLTLLHILLEDEFVVMTGSGYLSRK
jgi:hypothetical protein